MSTGAGAAPGRVIGARAGWARAGRIFAGVALIELALLPPSNYSLDGASMLAVADSLWDHGGIDVACDLGPEGRGGLCYSRWYPLMSVLALPFVGVGQVIGGAVGLPPVYAGHALAGIIPALSTAGAAAACALLARRLGAGAGVAVLAACAFAFGTEALVYSRTMYAEALAALLVAVAALGLLERGPRRFVGLAACALAVVAKPPMVVVGPALGLGLALRKTPPSARRVARRDLCGGLLFLGYNVLRFGAPFDDGGSARSVGIGTGGGSPDGASIGVVDGWRACSYSCSPPDGG